MIQSLLPRGTGHQFVCYADSCSGVPGAPHEKTFAAVNAVVRRLRPQPEFICFPGDEIVGLTADADELRRQWRYWLDHELAWLDRAAIPFYHTTGNHTTYDDMSEAVFKEMLSHLPRNGPADQQGLSYFVRRGDLLMVFVHTLWSGLGGEGRVETVWLDQTLADHADARHKLVFGHHPVFPVNGFSGPYQREIGPEDGEAFWRILVRHGVLAYVCSHILAFDVQVHDGVLQILTAGAGTAHRMPEEIEYLHCVQAALDGRGLRYQVLDTEGTDQGMVVVADRFAGVLDLGDAAVGSRAGPQCRNSQPNQPCRRLELRRNLSAGRRGCAADPPCRLGARRGAGVALDRSERTGESPCRPAGTTGGAQSASLARTNARTGSTVCDPDRDPHRNGAGRSALALG